MREKDNGGSSAAVIESLQNPRTKQWTQLLEKKGRDKQGRFLIEGVHLVQEALRSDLVPETLVYSAARREACGESAAGSRRAGRGVPGRQRSGAGQMHGYANTSAGVRRRAEAAVAAAAAPGGQPP
ncbi:hypothetical protein LJK88_06730 [Paenibacillus sp. P26]|nr:hypothetical protein LJK88_06730 [Paenibacillus sp. P26]